MEFVSLGSMKITSSEPKHSLGRSGKMLIISLSINTIGGSNKTRSRGMQLIMSVWRIFQRISRSFNSFLIRVMCRRSPDMNPLKLNLYIKTASKVYDESLCPELARWPCMNGKDWHKTHSNLSHLWFRLNIIKRDHHKQKLIASMFYRQERIRKC